MGVSPHTFRRKKKKMEAYSLLRLRARPVCASSSSILIHGKFCWACVRMTLITKMMRSWRKKNLLESLLRLIREKKMWTTSFTFEFPWIKQSNFFSIYKMKIFFLVHSFAIWYENWGLALSFFYQFVDIKYTYM